jgi:hypothetical protein
VTELNCSGSYLNLRKFLFCKFKDLIGFFLISLMLAGIFNTTCSYYGGMP